MSNANAEQIANEPTPYTEPEQNDDDIINRKYLTFTSDGLHFGLNASYVIEIITSHSITHLPMVPNYVKGIINLRGQIIPIIDIRLKMNKPEIEYTEKSCIIVIDVDGIAAGILVDSISNVLDINYEEISAPPKNNEQDLVNGIISLPEAVVMMLDCKKFVSE